ncbi:cysteine desulfurase family protein [bacterium]
MKKIYFDNISGTPVHPEVFKEMMPYLTEHFGNPQAIHIFGEAVKEAIDHAREKVAGLINAKPNEIYFTANGTESNNFALKGLALANQNKGKHIIISSIEHHSIMHPAKSLENQGFKISYIPVDKFGMINPDDVLKEIKDDTILVSIMFANSEVGTIQPIDEISKIVKQKGILFHTDAVAAAGIIPIDAAALNIDALSLTACQFYGPKGAAALYLKNGVRILPFLEGGTQEDGRRAGTENVYSIVGLGKSAELAKQEMNSRINILTKLRDKLIKELPKTSERIYVTGSVEKRLPHHASFCIEFVEGESMLLNLSMKGIAVSSGSVCTSKILKASHVLKAMNIPTALAQGSIVFSLGISNTVEDIEYVLQEFPPIIEKLRSMSPLYAKYLKQKGEQNA